MNPIEMLLDENYNGPITLYSETGAKMEFQQIAIIPEDGILYAILKPIDDGVLADNEALVFTLVEYEGEPTLLVCDDDAIITRIFNIYYDLLRQSGVDV